MSQIRRLDSKLSARIAAGEVIERPQSVVRELVDNAVDAGAKEITLSIRGGGIDEILVSDDGGGIMKDDLPLAVTQYATSKIATLDDLYHLHTMGFRGEALHSISAVSRLTIASSYEGQKPWTMTVDNMVAEDLVPIGPDRGTMVKVENLFSHIPARRAFLKRPSSEGTLCRNTFLAKAMAFEKIHFRFIQDGVLKVDLPVRNGIFDRVMDILTLEENFNRKEFVYLEKKCRDFTIRLITSLSGVHRSDRSRIRTYVNDRPVDEYALVQAVVYGYGEILPGGAFPWSVLFVDDDPELVDFNIHPAKREVKLRNKAEIHHEIHQLIHSSLPREIPTISAGAGDDEQPLLEPAARSTTSWQDPVFTHDRIKFASSRHSTSHAQQAEAVAQKPRDSAWLEKAKTLFSSPKEERHVTTSVSAQEFWKPDKESFTYLGQAFRLFLVCQKDDALYLVDQHAAHERILFNELRQQRDVQRLLIPLEFEVDPDVDAFLAENSYIYTQYGITIAQKDDRLWELTSIPHSAKENERKLVSFIQNAVGSEEEIEAGLYAIVACKAAIKAGDTLDDQSAIALLEKVFELEDPSCPHGRTFVIRLSEKELRLMVGRTK